MEESQEASGTLLSLLSDNNFVSTNSFELEEACESESSIILQVHVENHDDDNNVSDYQVIPSDGSDEACYVKVISQ